MVSRVLAGRYEITERIDQQGITTRYLAHDMSLKRVVMTIECSQEESSFVATYLSVHIDGFVHVYDAFQENDHIYIVVPWDEGVTSRQWLDRSGHESGFRMARVASAVGQTARGLLHSRLTLVDVQPEDVMVYEDERVAICYARLHHGADEDCTCQALGKLLRRMLDATAHGVGVEPSDSVVPAMDPLRFSLQRLADQMINEGSEPIGHSRTLLGYVSELARLGRESPQQQSSPKFVESPTQRTAAQFEEPRTQRASPTLDTVHRQQGPQPVERITQQPSQNNVPHVPQLADAASSEFARRTESFRSIDRKGMSRRSWIRPTLWIASGAVVVAACGAFLIIPRLNQLTVPDLRGESISAAKKQLVAAGWTGSFVLERRPVLTGPAGDIVEQTPMPGITIHKNDSVTLVVGKAATVQGGVTPDWTGQNAQKVISSLLAAHVPASNITLQATQTSGQSGSIVGQEPKAGTSMDQASTHVVLNITIGKGESLVPFITGLPIDRAGSVLIAASLHYNYTIDRHGGNANTVAEQSVAPGSVVPAGTDVNLHVFDGNQ